MAKYIVLRDEKRYEVDIGNDGKYFIDDCEFPVDIKTLASDQFSLLCKGRSMTGAVSRKNDIYQVIIGSFVTELKVESPAQAFMDSLLSQRSHGPKQDEVRAPMPGLVVRCEVREGEVVIRGQGLLVLEAMKMENEIKSSHAGIVRKVCVADKQVVEKGELLMIIGESSE